MFGRKSKKPSLPKGPKLSDAIESAQKDALVSETLSGIRKVVTDHRNQKQFADYSYSRLYGEPIHPTAQARLDRYNESKQKTQRYSLRSGVSRVAAHDAEMAGMRRAYEKLTPPDDKAQQVLWEAQSGKSFEKSADTVREGFAKLDKQSPNSYEKWAD